MCTRKSAIMRTSSMQCELNCKSLLWISYCTLTLSPSVMFEYPLQPYKVIRAVGSFSVEIGGTRLTRKSGLDARISSKEKDSLDF